MSSKETAPGPDTTDHDGLTAPGGCGRPSSATDPVSATAVPATAPPTSGPAFAVGAVFVEPEQPGDHCGGQPAHDEGGWSVALTGTTTTEALTRIGTWSARFSGPV